jgi:hypothetical protein
MVKFCLNSRSEKEAAGQGGLTGGKYWGTLKRLVTDSLCPYVRQENPDNQNGQRWLLTALQTCG